jgi:hypothetical protein
MNTIEETSTDLKLSDRIDPKIQKRNEYARNYYRKKYQENEAYREVVRERTKKRYHIKKAEFELLKKLYNEPSLVVA